MCSASVSYSGRLIMRETRLASMAAAIRLSTIEWPSTISITMMKAVSGACVTAARKPAMPMAMSAGPQVAAGQPGDRIADARADRQRRREDAARHAAPGREPGGDELQHRVQRREFVMPLQHLLDRLGARAEGDAARHQPDDGHCQPARGREAHRKARPPAVEAPGRAGQRGDQQPREQAAGRAAQQRDQQAGAERVPAQPGHADHAEIAGVAEGRHRHQAGQHDGRDDQAAGAGLEPARQLLDGEHHAGQRRIERRRDAGRAAGHQQRARVDGGAGRKPAPRVLHHPGGHLHRRALAPDRQAGREARHAQADLGDREPQRGEHEAAFFRQGGCSAALICGMPEPPAPGKKRSVAQTMPAVISGVVSSTAQGQAR
jgi:hypothetical protein